MATAFRLPDLGEGITEAEIIRWLVTEGDTVDEHQPLVEVETDKAVVEVPSPAAGTIRGIRHRVGDTIRVGETLVLIQREGEPEGASSEDPSDGGRESTTVVGTLDNAAVVLPPQHESEAVPASSRILATPAVRRLARELGVSLSKVRGTGLSGRITEADLRAISSIGNRSELGGAIGKATLEIGEGQRVPLRGARKTIARRLEAAVARAPLATHMDEIDASALAELCQNEDARPRRPFPWIVRAVAIVLGRHPRWNAHFDEARDELVLLDAIHVGIACDTPNGLLVPVLRDADRRTVAELALGIERLSEAAQDRSLAVGDLRGGTFSISNVGALGGRFATPIPNPPEVGILATGRIREHLVRLPDGEIGSEHLLPVSLTFDHRVLDGADAARFTREIEVLLTEPSALDV